MQTVQKIGERMSDHMCVNAIFDDRMLILGAVSVEPR